MVKPVGSSGTPAVSINDVTVTEGNSGTVNATFTVRLSSAATKVVTVNWTTADGTGTAGIDFIAGSGIVSFAPGDTTQTVTVLVNGDTVVEANETFSVNLSNAVNVTIADGQGVGTILNDDQPPSTVHIGDLDGSKSVQKKTNTWTASVRITVQRRHR